MKKKLALYASLPMLALLLTGASAASAHGMFGFGFMGKQLTPDEIAQGQTDRFQQEANLLGISIDDIKNAWAKGETLQQLATEKGISQDQLKQKLNDLAQQKMKDRLQNLVSKGVITQSQADQRLQFMSQRMQNIQNMKMNRGFRGGMFGL